MELLEDKSAVAGASEPLVSSQRSRPWWGLALVAGLALTCLCGVFLWTVFRSGRDDVSLVSQLTSLLEQPTRDQVAFIGNDGNVWLTSSDGSVVHQLTYDARGYSFPTWSPNGQFLAFLGPNEANNRTLYVSTLADDKPAELFTSIESAPFYLYWAPNSQSISYLTQERGGLAMRLSRPDQPGTNRIIAKGAPFYWVWSPKGDKIFLHVGGSRSVSEEAHLSIVDNELDSSLIQLDLAPGLFQAPIWSMDGRHIFYVAEDGAGRQRLYKTEADTLSQTAVVDLRGPTFVVASPTDQYLAYLEVRRSAGPPLGTAYVVDVDGQEPRQVLEDLVMTMYWSPDGSKLALLTPTFTEDDSAALGKFTGLAAPLPQTIAFRWWIYDVETERLDPLTTFDATPEFLQTVPFFDQYHLSLTFWSPDSRFFVLTQANGADTGGTVWVIDTTGQEPDRQIGEGTMAVWSWH
jgi:TolB protein